MNYKKCNIIGVISFIIIILFMVNLNYFLEVLNHNILNIKFVGIKNGELFLSELSDIVLTKDDLLNYINSNIKQIGESKLNGFDFSIYVRNVEEQDNFREKFRISIDENFTDTLYKNLNLIPKNQDLLLKFVVYSKDNTYVSTIFGVKIVDEVYRNEGKIILELDDFTTDGVSSFVSIPKYLKLISKNKVDITAKHGELDIKSLTAYVDELNLKIIIENLVPLKEYSHIKMSTKNSEGTDVILRINNIVMQPETNLQEYLSRVYLVVLGRYPYEGDYKSTLIDLKDNKISINEFLNKFISNEEFNTVNDTPKKIVDGIYYLVNKKSIDGRVSTLVLDEFNQLLLSSNTREEAKLEILNRFLSSESSSNYIEKQLNFKVQ